MMHISGVLNGLTVYVDTDTYVEMFDNLSHIDLPIDSIDTVNIVVDDSLAGTYE